MKKRLGILISGRGSNLEAIADNIDAGRLEAQIALVIANTPRAAGLERARARGLKAECIRSRAMEREDYDRLLVERLRAERVELVCLAGFMRLLSAYFVEQFPQRILNIHPSLLPAFPDSKRSAKRWSTASASRAARCISWTSGWTPGRSSPRPRCPSSTATTKRRSRRASWRKNTASTAKRSPWRSAATTASRAGACCAAADAAGRQA